jgi:hypothetical protein
MNKLIAHPLAVDFGDSWKVNFGMVAGNRKGL